MELVVISGSLCGGNKCCVIWIEPTAYMWFSKEWIYTVVHYICLPSKCHHLERYVLVFCFSFIFYPYQFPIFVSYCFVIWWSYDWKYDAHIAAHSDTTVARMLVGNKCDLENIRDISVDEGKSLAEAEGLFFMETSALDSTNVQKAFEIVIKEIYNNVSRKVLNSDSYKAELSVNRVSLVKDDSHGSKQASSCCSIWDLFCQGIHRCGWFALHPFVLWLVLYSPEKTIEVFYFTNSFFLVVWSVINLYLCTL